MGCQRRLLLCQNLPDRSPPCRSPAVSYTHLDVYKRQSKDFKEIYNSLDKQEFLRKINALIEEYGLSLIHIFYIPFGVGYCLLLCKGSPEHHDDNIR